MEELLVAAAEKVPALLVLVFLVVAFLKHIRTEGKNNREHLEQEGEANRAMLTGLEEAIKSEGAANRQVLKEVSEVVGRTTSKLTE